MHCRGAGRGGGLGPHERELAPAQVSERLAQGHQVCERLQRVPQHALHVDHGHARVPRPEADLRIASIDFPARASRLGADGERVRVTGEHRGRVLDVLGSAPVHDRAFGRLELPEVAGGGEVDRVAPKLRHRRFERGARAQRAAEEQQAHSLARQAGLRRAVLEPHGEVEEVRHLPGGEVGEADQVGGSAKFGHGAEPTPLRARVHAASLRSWLLTRHLAITKSFRPYAPIAQLDRASDYGSEG